MAYPIRVIGDPVLTQRAAEVDDIDGKIARLAEDMLETMYEAPGIGLAAPQVGVQKRLFVYDHDGEPGVLINPEIRESSGEWVFQEGCLSIPGLYFDIVRPKEILLVGLDLDGNEVHIEADELQARLFQHELDHLDGVLMIEHLDADQRKQAKRAIRELRWRDPQPSGAPASSRWADPSLRAGGGPCLRLLPAIRAGWCISGRLPWRYRPLRALHDAGHEIALVVSRADKRRGRGGGLHPSPVKAAALDLGLPVTDRLEEALEVGADLGVVVAYGRLIPTAVLERLPMVNLHFSLLPRWRGAAPLERAILAGDEVTGVCLMRVEEGLDTGGVYARTEVPIGPDDTAAELRDRLVAAGVTMLLNALVSGLGEPVPQVGEPTYAEKLRPEELRLDWTRSAAELHRIVRVGGAYTSFRGKRLKIWRTRLVDASAGQPGGDPGGAGLRPGELMGTSVVTGRGLLELVEVQPEGRSRIDARSWRNGVRPRPGERLGDGT